LQSGFARSSPLVLNFGKSDGATAMVHSGLGTAKP
jgi:hypothetical protein